MFVGEQFDDSGSYTCEVTYANSKSDSCTVSSATEVTADFTNGIGTQAAASSPKLKFTSIDGTHSHDAKPAPDVVLDNPLSITSSTSGLVSSFAGGREFSVTAAGLTQNIIAADAEVRICQKPCEHVAASSDAETFVCETPRIATTKSNELFQICEEASLKGSEVIFAGMQAEDAALAFND